MLSFDLSKQYPLAKFALALALGIGGMLLPLHAAKFAAFALIVLLAIMCGCLHTFFKRTFASVGVLIVLLVIVQALFYGGQSEIISIGPISIKLVGVMFALDLSLNLLCLASALIWFFTITKEKDFVYALTQKGLGPKASFVILSAFLMIPVLKRKSEVIMCAQKSRGVETEGSLVVRAKAFIPSMVPLVLSAITSTEERSLTLEARGFSVIGKRTSIYSLTEDSLDKLLYVLSIIIFICALVWSILSWLS